MTEKRFTVHIDWFNYDKDEGEATLKDNGQPLLCSESVGDVRWLKELLNELNDENEQLKSEIEKITKYKEHWAFISDCSIQVMNEEEKFKEDYLRIATNELKKLQEENEQLKQQIGNLEHTRDFCADVCADCKRLEEENEQLKQQCKDFMEMLADMCIGYLVNDGLEEILND